MLFHSSKNPTELKVIHLNKAQKQRCEELQEAMEDKQGVQQFKQLIEKKAKQALKDKTQKTKAKDKDSSRDNSADNAATDEKNSDKKIYVLDFDGDLKASAVAHLREEISTIVSVANKGDEVILRLESPGGLVHGYGLAAAQLARIKEAGLTLTVCVDKVAASGGYMMACVADKILAAPFAVIGSIGVVSQMPNFNKWLKNHDIDYEMFTAGEYKRTVTIFGENTDEDRAKYKEELEQTHKLFKHFVNTYRPELDLTKVSNGDHWYGEDAVHLGLVDELTASDSYILEQIKTHDVYALQSQKKPTLAEKLGFAAAAETAINMAIDKLPEAVSRLEQRSKLF